MSIFNRRHAIPILVLGLASSALAQAQQVSGLLVQDNYGDCINDLPFEAVKAAVQKPPHPGSLPSGEILPETRVEGVWPKNGKFNANGVDIVFDLSRLHMRFRPDGVAANETAKILDYTTLCQQYMTRGGSYQEHCRLEDGKPKTGLVTYETVTTLWNRSWDENADPTHIYKGKYPPCRAGTQVIINYAITPDMTYANNLGGPAATYFTDTYKAKKLDDFAVAIFKKWIDGFKVQ